jgi:hypothetical protein
MFTKEERVKRKLIARDDRYIFCRLHDRGKKLFGNVSPRQMWKECYDATLDPNRSVIVPDLRDKASTHKCMFISDSNNYVCLPCIINDTHIIITTIENISEDENQGWYIRNYNEIARTRGMPLMNLRFS